MKALAPRLREIAPKLPHYEVERDAQFFAEFENLADNIGKILAALADIKPTIEKTAAGVDELVDRPRRLAEGYEADYLEALCTELNRVEIIGLYGRRAGPRRRARGGLPVSAHAARPARRDRHPSTSRR